MPVEKHDTGPLHGVAHYMRKRARDLAPHNMQRRQFESYAVICDGAALHIAKLERLIDTMEKLIPPSPSEDSAP